jgi:hypothetical protein
VVHATQTLVETEADLRQIERLGAETDQWVEAGDASALALLQGACRWCWGRTSTSAPRAAGACRPGRGALGAAGGAVAGGGGLHPAARASGDGLGAGHRDRGLGLRPPAAVLLGALLHRAPPRRAQGPLRLPCLDDPDGRLVRSGEGEDFLVLNGTQTQSAGVHCLLDQAGALAAAGVQRLRLSPSSAGFGQVLADFDAVFNGGASPRGRSAAWASLGVPGPLVSGYAFGRPGMAATATSPLEMPA